MIEYLIKLGVDVNGKDRCGWTPLHFACRRGDGEIVRLLLTAGADPNVINDNGMTPLHLNIVEKTCLKVIELLLKFGADPLMNSPGPCADNIVKAIAFAEKPQVEALFAKYRKK